MNGLLTAWTRRVPNSYPFYPFRVTDVSRVAYAVSSVFLSPTVFVRVHTKFIPLKVHPCIESMPKSLTIIFDPP